MFSPVIQGTMELPEEVKVFLLESYENLDRVEDDLLILEKDPGNVERLNSVFRAIHTIKGNSGFLGLKGLETVCHRGETVLDRLRSGKLKLSADLASVLLELVDLIRSFLSGVEDSGEEPKLDSSTVIGKLAPFVA